MQQCGRAAAGAALRDLLQSSLAHIAHDTGPAQCLRHVRTAAAPSIGSLTPTRFDHESWAWQPHVWRPHSSSCQRRNRRIATQPENDVAARTSCNSKVADETTSLQEYAVVKLYRGPHIRAVAFFMRVKIVQLVATGAAAFPLLLHVRGDRVPVGELVGSGILTASAAAACWALWFYGQRYVGELALLIPASQLQRPTPPGRAIALQAEQITDAGGQPRTINPSLDESGGSASLSTAQDGNHRAPSGSAAAQSGAPEEQAQPSRLAGAHESNAALGTESVQTCSLPEGSAALAELQPDWVRLSTLDFWGVRQDADVPLSRFIPPLLGLSQRRAQELAGGMFVPVDVAQDKQYLLSVKHGRVLEPSLLMRLLRGQFHEAERDEDP